MKAFSSVQFNCSVMSDSLWPHGLQHARLPCLSPTPRACPNSSLSSRWCHPTISSSFIPFSSCLQSFWASGSFQMSQFFKLGDQSIGVSASASVLPKTIQDWFPLGLTGLISFSPRDSQKSSPTPQFKSINCSVLSFLSEKAMAPHSRTLLWEIPWTEGPGRLQPMVSLRVRHDWATSLSLFTFMHWRRKWQPTPVFLPGESQGLGSLVGCRLWGHTELDTTEMT